MSLFYFKNWIANPNSYFFLYRTQCINIIILLSRPTQPILPILAAFSACVPPALQNGFVNSSDLENFESHKHSYTQYWSHTLLDFFPLWVTLATLVDVLICNGAELGGATGAMAPLVFWSRSLKKSRKVSKSLEIKVS